MKREQWGILLAFLGGIFLANLLGRELLTTHGILNEYYLSQYSYHRVDESRLLCHVILERSKAAIVILLLGHSLSGRIFSVLVKGGVTAGLGFLIVAAIVNLGVKGIVVCLAGILPQWLFYFAALFLYANGKRQGMPSAWGVKPYGKNILEQIAEGILPGILLLFGMLAESYVSPVLLGYILKVF